MSTGASRYSRIVEKIFFDHYEEGDRKVCFDREELIHAASELEIAVPKNLGDILYSFRFRRALPDSINSRAPEGEQWIIRLRGSAYYCFALVSEEVAEITPNPLLPETKVPDATPGLIARYALSDEQALLAKLRYNRLIDVFTGVTCYSLQNHLRTTVEGLGQVETDEVYVGIDRSGSHFILPVQAKGGTDKLGVVQIEQDLALCAEKFPDLLCIAIAAQFMGPDLIAVFQFIEEEDAGLVLLNERHYRLVPQEEISSDDLRAYQERLERTEGRH